MRSARNFGVIIACIVGAVASQSCIDDACEDCTDVLYACSWSSIDFGVIPPVEIGGGSDLCVDNEAEAQDVCQDACDNAGVCQHVVVSLAPCEGNEDPDGTGSGIGCSGWDPDAAVTYDGNNRWDVDEDFWENLLANTTPLWNCDSAEVADTGTYWEWRNIAAGDLADELGFQNDDEIMEIDGITIVTADDAFTVFALKSERTTHTVKFKRNGNTITHTYRIR